MRDLLVSRNHLRKENRNTSCKPVILASLDLNLLTWAWRSRSSSAGFNARFRKKSVKSKPSFCAAFQHGSRLLRILTRVS